MRIWREPELSDEFAVSDDGVVVLPLLGERRVTGVPAGELEERLESEYAGFLENPSIEVTALRRIAVLGEVRSPGLYTVDTTVRLVEAIAQAGGVTAEGDPGDLRVLREGSVIRPVVQAGLIMEPLPIRSGDQIVVGRRSWLNRNLPILSIGIGTLSAAVAAAIVAGG